MQIVSESKKLQKKVGENIENIRLLKRKTIKEMAHLLGLTDTGYRNIERGITEITIAKLFQLSEIFEIHYSQLIEFSPNSFVSIKQAPHVNIEINNSIFEGYKVCIQSLKEENLFLRKQLSLLATNMKS
ncbi:MAG: helix-turn-helix transcriptional regulator [Bacteroidota bacterium]